MVTANDGEDVYELGECFKTRNRLNARTERGDDDEEEGEEQRKSFGLFLKIRD
jgi:hypothetical protein